MKKENYDVMLRMWVVGTSAKEVEARIQQLLKSAQWTGEVLQLEVEVENLEGR